MATKVKKRILHKKVVQKIQPKKVTTKKVYISPKETIQPEIVQITSQPEVVQIAPQSDEVRQVTPPPEVETLSSSSMLDDLMSTTDKDNEVENENSSTDDLLNELDNEDSQSETESTNHQTENSASDTENFADKISDTITNEGDDWQNPSDFRKMCAVNAMMYVEGGAILLSFIGQAISGDWSPEGEKKYSPSEDRKKVIRAPLAKKFELNKDRSKSTPTGALITAIIFTIIPIVIIAFKDRKQRIKIEAQNIENLKLKQDVNRMNEELNILRSQKPVPTNTVKNDLQPFLIKKRGRHKNDCDCDKCNLKKVKSKK